MTLSWQRMTYKPSNLGQTDLVLVCDQSSSVDLCIQDYKSEYVAVMIVPPWLTDRHTGTRTESCLLAIV